MSATLALIAHDGKKDDIVGFAQRHQAVLSRYRLIATGSTGERIQAATNLTIERMLSGPMGGDAQIAAQVAEGNISGVIFLIDPLNAQPHEPDIQALHRICAVHNIPIATNLATAEIILDVLRRRQIGYLIFNPVSGNSNPTEDLTLIKKLLEPAMELVIQQTTPDVDAAELTQRAIASQADLIIASGGDGTVSAVAGELIGTDIPLGVIPRGTANAFAVALGIAARLNPINRACEVIIAAHTRIVDAARCNGLPMILLAGIGLEAETVERADRETKNRWGVLAYIMAGLRQFQEQELFETEIEVKGVVKTFQAGAVTIANAAPSTSVMAQGLGRVVEDDGLLNITIAAPQTELQAVTAMVDLLGSALLRTPSQRSDIIGLEAARIKVTTKPPQKVALDGEIIGTTPVEIECIPGGLSVFAPPKNNANGEQTEN
ncbi:MAG: methylglyoxal synthase [Microcoleaceae cyanobacterium]